MPSRASLTFDYAIQDAVDLITHFDRLNTSHHQWMEKGSGSFPGAEWT